MALEMENIRLFCEVIGAIAIVISLVYLGIQVSDSARAVRSETANSSSTSMSNWYVSVGSDKEASRIVFNGFTAPSQLDRLETAQFIYLIHGLFLEYQAAYYSSVQGTLDVEMQESLTNTILGVRELPGVELYWSQREVVFKPSFREFASKLLKTGKTNSVSKLYELAESLEDGNA